LQRHLSVLCLGSLLRLRVWISASLAAPGHGRHLTDKSGENSKKLFGFYLDHFKVKLEPGLQYPSKKKDKKKPHIKKPLNAFMLYMKEMRPKVVAECTLKESAAINQILGRKWHALTREEQAKYYEQARKERQLHMQMYPGWSARDNYAQSKEKRKRKREKAQESGGNPLKKCRARWGVDQTEQWCKPCKRKKKCVRDNPGDDLTDDNDDSDSDDDPCQNISIPTLYTRFSHQPIRGHTPENISTCRLKGRELNLFNVSHYLPKMTSAVSDSLYRKMSSPASLASLSAISKASFGSDPRNANHPLSISQLTSSHKKQSDK